MYKVKAVRTTGPVIYACGTADQAYDRSLDLMSSGATEVVVVDPTGKEWPASEFIRNVEKAG